MSDFRLMCAPMQGFTDAVFRCVHAQMFGVEVEYITPFIRVEKGVVRRRDISDWLSPLNKGLNLVPQIIFRDVKEFNLLVDSLIEEGVRRIDMNLGCPFPPQVRKGRGAGIIEHRDVLAEVLNSMKQYTQDVSFSVKMRLGVSSPNEWHLIAHVLDEMPLTHITVHPRTASQQYSGLLYYDEFEILKCSIRHPVMFNGDIMSPSDIDRLLTKFPGLAGVMVGRGLLYRPSLFTEWKDGYILDNESLTYNSLRLHTSILKYYEDKLCGDTQVLSKIQPFVEYLAPYVDRKIFKGLIKARRLTDYHAILNTILQ